LSSTLAVAEGCAKCLIGQPDEAARIGRQLWCRRMRLLAMEYLTNCLTFIGRQSRNEDQRPNSYVEAGAYHSARISVRDQNQRTMGPLQCSLECGNVIRQ
jgi:hypothetical protein